MDPSLIDWSDVAAVLSGQSSPRLSGLYTGPYFSLYTAGNVSVRLGEVAHLPCRVHQVNNHTVSWVRSRDSAILSIDGETIIHDRRMAVIKTINRGDYVLAIRWTVFLEKNVFLLNILRLIIYGTFHLILSQSNLSEIKCQRNNLYWVGGVWDSLTLSWNEIFYL